MKHLIVKRPQKIHSQADFSVFLELMNRACSYFLAFSDLNRTIFKFLRNLKQQKRVICPLLFFCFYIHSLLFFQVQKIFLEFVE